MCRIGATGMAGKVMKNEKMDNSRKNSAENFFSTSQNSQDQLAELKEMPVSEIDDIQELDIFHSASNSTSNFPAFLNNELETQDLVGLKWTLGKEETHISKTLQEEFEGVKISEIISENDIATNTNITQDRFLKEETNPNSQDLSIPKEESQTGSIYSHKAFQKQGSEKIAQKYLEKPESEVRELPAEIEGALQGKVALKTKSWNSQNQGGVSEFSSKVKPPSNSTSQHSETWSLEHKCESTRETSSIISKIQRDAFTIPKPKKFHEVSKCCRSKDVIMSPKNESSIDPKRQDVGCEQKQDFFDCQSHSSFQKKLSKKKASPTQKLDYERPSQISSSSSRTRSQSGEKRTSLDACKVSKLSDESAPKSIEWSSSPCSEFKLARKKDSSRKSSLSFPDHDDSSAVWSMMQFRKVPSPDSSLEFLQNKISSLLNDDQYMDTVMEIADLAQKNIKLEDEVSQKETKIDKLAERSDSVIEKCEEIEVGVVSNLVITDDRISKLSRAMKIARRFQIENNALWHQIKQLRDMLAEKDRKISRLVLSKSNDAKRDEIRYLKEKMNNLETQNMALSANFRNSAKMCKQYEKDLEEVDRNLKRAEDKLRLTFVDLKEIVKTQATKRKPQEIENDISKSGKEEKENTKKDRKEAVREARAENTAPTKEKDSLDKPGERIDKSEAHTDHPRKSYKRPFRKTPQEVNGSSEVKHSQGV